MAVGSRTRVVRLFEFLRSHANRGRFTALQNRDKLTNLKLSSQLMPISCGCYFIDCWIGTYCQRSNFLSWLLAHYHISFQSPWNLTRSVARVVVYMYIWQRIPRSQAIYLAYLKRRAGAKRPVYTDPGYILQTNYTNSSHYAVWWRNTGFHHGTGASQGGWGRNGLDTPLKHSRGGMGLQNNWIVCPMLRYSRLFSIPTTFSIPELGFAFVCVASGAM